MDLRKVEAMEKVWSVAGNVLRQEIARVIPLGSRWIVRHTWDGRVARAEVVSHSAPPTGHMGDWIGDEHAEDAPTVPTFVRVRYLGGKGDYRRNVYYGDFLQRIDGGADTNDLD